MDTCEKGLQMLKRNNSTSGVEGNGDLYIMFLILGYIIFLSLKADATLETEQRQFSRSSLEYILFLQEVQERKKFEFVETILSFMYGWLTFYHEGHEVAKDFKSFSTDLQKKLQKTRENFDATHAEAKQLMIKLLEKPLDSGSLNKMFTRQGYLYLMEKKALGTTWTKHFCQYQKENHKFTMIPYSQTTGKVVTSRDRRRMLTIQIPACSNRKMADPDFNSIDPTPLSRKNTECSVLHLQYEAFRYLEAISQLLTIYLSTC
ncbi:rho GTPase-activating protein 26 [Trichonephila clavata]|uniref:Rho GTPase-activating protein 26 n=1 Tax=Trichonephila clavata TaxID=2740835 RepID=A0A8X6G265_TRICU|nr:rho GTPase-activating protein 26 [Trichonephila clavata]